MSLPYSRAPHTTGAPGAHSEAPNAALLIDFDNVTMGMRSDLSKELKNLLNSDIIKGKVTVQRAYADWRRYPQYIVPLSENSVDLIFAPAYGSSKKNATDIRMAIDGMELVFIRPEIGTFILLTGDSDFSSLVLKLKEYGKYVIGVGIQESSSDILVQNCDEYYSYTSLAGLRKTTDSINKAVDPWVLVEQAVQRMASRNDVMRSDRLKQVMMEIDPTFDEGNFGFSKFSRFLSEASNRDLVDLRKLENGQYEIRPRTGGKEDAGKDRGGAQRRAAEKGREKEKDREDRSSPSRTRTRDQGPPKEDGKAEAGEPKAEEPRRTPAGTDPLQAAYGLLRKALEELSEGNGAPPVRDSDLKRKMLEMEPSFDEGELGFGKFSRFLRQAHDHEAVDLEKREDGTYQVSLRVGELRAQDGSAGGGETETDASTPESRGAAEGGSASEGILPEEEFGKQAAIRAGASKGLGPRRGERKGRRGKDGPPPLLEGQVVSLPGTSTGRRESQPGEDAGVSGVGGGVERVREAVPVPEGEVTVGATEVDTERLGLPTDGDAIIRYLTNSYKGVGKKTAESLVEAFGPGLFSVLEAEPERIAPIVSGKRAELLLDGWRADFRRRSERQTLGDRGRPGPAEQVVEASTEDAVETPGDAESAGGETDTSGKPPSSRRRTRRGGRSRRG
ncbi:MAG: NYN domain-containing protein [Longimicrobiales bacterium]